VVKNIEIGAQLMTKESKEGVRFVKYKPDEAGAGEDMIRRTSHEYAP
jgi:hypothetical protein